MARWINLLHSLVHVFSSHEFVYDSEGYWKSIAFLGLLECFALSLVYLVIKFVCRKMEREDDDDDESPLLIGPSSAPHSPTLRLMKLQQLNSYPHLLGIVSVALLTVTAFACQGIDNFRQHSAALLSLSMDLVDAAKANGGSGTDLDSLYRTLKYFQVYMLR